MGSWRPGPPGGGRRSGHWLEWRTLVTQRRRAGVGQPGGCVTRGLPGVTGAVHCLTGKVGGKLLQPGNQGKTDDSGLTRPLRGKVLGSFSQMMVDVPTGGSVAWTERWAEGSRCPATHRGRGIGLRPPRSDVCASVRAVRKRFPSLSTVISPQTDLPS